MVVQLNATTLLGSALGSLFFQVNDSGTTTTTTTTPGGGAGLFGAPTDDGTTEGAAGQTEGIPEGWEPILVGGEIIGWRDPNDDGSREEATPKFSTVNPYEYNIIREFIIENFFGGKTEGGDRTTIGAFIDAWAESLAEGEGKDVEYPTLDDLVANPKFRQGAAFLPYAGRLPTDQVVTVTDPETGELDGYYRIVYDPLEGLQQVNVTETFLGGSTPGVTPASSIAANDVVNPNETPNLSEVGASEVANTRPDILSRLDPQTQAALTGNVTINHGPQGVAVTVVPKVMPIEQYLNDFLKRPEPPRAPGGGGPRIDWDRRKLQESATEQWRQWLFEDPALPAVSRMVDGYITEATAFWKRSGGRIMDYGAYVREKLQETNRFKSIYRYKPEDVDVDEFIASMKNPISSLGLRSQTVRDETFTAIQSGGSVQGQVNRVANTTREGRQATNFSRRLAATLSGLGAGGRT